MPAVWGLPSASTLPSASQHPLSLPGQDPTCRPALPVPAARLRQGGATGSDNQSYQDLDSSGWVTQPGMFRKRSRKPQPWESTASHAQQYQCHGPQATSLPKASCGCTLIVVQSLLGSCPFSEPCFPDFRWILRTMQSPSAQFLFSLTTVRFSGVQRNATTHKSRIIKKEDSSPPRTFWKGLLILSCTNRVNRCDQQNTAEKTTWLLRRGPKRCPGFCLALPGITLSGRSQLLGHKDAQTVLWMDPQAEKLRPPAHNQHQLASHGSGSSSPSEPSGVPAADRWDGVRLPALF